LVGCGGACLRVLPLLFFLACLPRPLEWNWGLWELAL
jgi:hypothetical protein